MSPSPLNGRFFRSRAKTIYVTNSHIQGTFWIIARLNVSQIKMFPRSKEEQFYLPLLLLFVSPANRKNDKTLVMENIARGTKDPGY